MIRIHINNLMKVIHYKEKEEETYISNNTIHKAANKMPI